MVSRRAVIFARAAAIGLVLAGAAGSSNAQAPDKLYYAPGAESIRRANLDGSIDEEVVAGTAIGVAIDASAGKLYWGAGAMGVRRSDLDGSNRENLTTGVHAGSVALDLVDRKVYWVLSHEIYRADLDGSEIEVVFDDDNVPGSHFNPVDIVVDGARGKVYFTADSYVYRGDLDGSNVVQLLSDSDIPAGIDLDLVNDKLYYCSADIGAVVRTNLDGTGREIVVIGGQSGFLAGFVAVDPDGGKVYWTDWFYWSGVWRANLDGSHLENIITDSPYGGFQLALLLRDEPSGVPAVSGAGLAVTVLLFSIASVAVVRRRSR